MKPRILEPGSEQWPGCCFLLYMLGGQSHNKADPRYNGAFAGYKTCPEGMMVIYIRLLIKSDVFYSPVGINKCLIHCHRWYKQISVLVT